MPNLGERCLLWVYLARDGGGDGTAPGAGRDRGAAVAAAAGSAPAARADFPSGGAPRKGRAAARAGARP